MLYLCKPGRYDVVTVGPSREPVTSKGGLRITPDIALDELAADDSAMLILCGADAWENGDNAGFGSKGSEHYVDEPAVTDRGLITAAATAPVEFAREVFAALELYEPSVLASWYKLYGLKDPAGYFELAATEAV